MRKLTRLAMLVTAALLVAAGTAVAATPLDFYTNLLRRGVADYNAGRYDAAAGELRIAAFGLLDSIDQYQVAQIYSTLAADKLARESEARRAAERVTAAEAVQARYASLSIPNDVRAAFETVAQKLLSSGQFARLRTGATSAPAKQPTPQTAARPAITPPPVTLAPAQSKPAATQTAPPKPQPAATKPAATTQTAQPQQQPPKRVEQREIPVSEIAVEPPKKTTTTTTTVTVPPPPTPTPAAKTVNVAARFATAEDALNRNDLPTARAALHDIADVTTLDHAALLRLAEDSYRARDFGTAIRAFRRLGSMTGGEEPYRYYYAVALYETGQYAQAKRELAAALPYIEVTPDVARYRTKIENAID